MIHVMEAVRSGESNLLKVYDVPPTTLKDQISDRVTHERNPYQVIFGAYFHFITTLISHA